MAAPLRIVSLNRSFGSQLDAFVEVPLSATTTDKVAHKKEKRESKKWNPLRRQR
jgi:hypothetical protein